MKKSGKKIALRLFADCVFRLMHNSTNSSLLQQVHTSYMAAVTIVRRMMSP